ncbi:MAG: dTMP kinase [Rhodospirillaceae bacterium]|jgi:dTMP kinase|nr:dTMP kinase [Rhodospirillaceae bacterium]
MPSGKFITFEGGEGAGKSTQIKRLAAAIEKTGLTVTVTREPGGSRGAETIRAMLLDPDAEWDPPTEALLHFAARADHYTTKIAPALKEGAWVLCDRFADSTRAYQGYGLGLDMGAIETLYEIALDDFVPDLTIILDIPVETGVERMIERGADPDRYEKMDTAFHERLRQGFLEIAKQDPDRCAVIDANNDIDTVTGRIFDCVETRMGVTLER